MITKDVRVVATFEELGNTLLESGKYSVAEINVQKPFQKDEICTIKKHSETIKEPVYAKSTRNINLNYAFVEMALNLNKNGESLKPEKPNQKATKKEWDNWKNWLKLSNQDKIRPHLEAMANDMQSVLVSFEILD